MAPAVRWRNAARFHGKLAKLPPAVFVAARTGLEDAATDMVDAMRRLVPVHSGELRDSIGWTYGDAPKDAKIIARILKPRGKSDSRITIFAGSFAAYYARWVEFGTKAHSAVSGYRSKRLGGRLTKSKRGHVATKAQPYFWVTWRSRKRTARSSITRRVNTAIKKLATEQGGGDVGN